MALTPGHFFVGSAFNRLLILEPTLPDVPTNCPGDNFYNRCGITSETDGRRNISNPSMRDLSGAQETSIYESEIYASSAERILHLSGDRE